MELNEIIIKTNADILHNMGYTGKGIKIAILDSGIDIDHEFLKDTKITSIKIAEGDLYGHGYFHGTHLAGIIKALAPDAELINIKILDDTGFTLISTILEGIMKAKENGADIINISVGELSFECPDNHPLSILINKLGEEGIIFCCAAGNQGQSRSPNIPASCKSAVSIGAVNENGRTTKYSSRGPICDREYPDCVAYGSRIISIFPNDEWGELTGSSQSTPQVSAMMALMKQAFKRSFIKEEIDYLLSQSCKPLESNNKNNISGWGLIDMDSFYRATQVYLGIL